MNERLKILGLIESGQISVEEGVRRLKELSQDEAGRVPGTEEDQTASTVPAEAAEPSAEPLQPAFVRIVWMIVFGVGITVVTGGGLLLARAYGREDASGLAWGWMLFSLGLALLVLGWWLQRARWFYLRVRERDGRVLTIAFPLPIGLVLWLLRVARPFVPQLQEMDVDKLILALRHELQDGRGIVVAVDEGGAGDQVEIYFR